jgi:hypothetical protein
MTLRNAVALLPGVAIGGKIKALDETGGVTRWVRRDGGW